MAGRLHNLSSWLLQPETRNLNIVLVHDIQDEETGKELDSLINKISSRNVTLINGSFGGPGAARNAGLDSVTTPWFAFWDSDDRPHVSAVLEMASSAEKSGKNIAIGEFQVRNAISNKIESFSITDGRKLKSEIALNPGLWRMVFRTSKYIDFRFPNYHMGEDQCWLANVMFDETEVLLNHKIIYEYVVGNSYQLTFARDSHTALTQTTNHLVGLFEESTHSVREFLSYLIVKQQFSLLKRGGVKSKAAAFWRIFQLLMVCPGPKLPMFIFCILGRRKQLNKPPSVIMYGGLGNQLFQLSAGSVFANGRPLELIYLNQRMRRSAVSRDCAFDLEMNQLYFCSYKQVSVFRIKLLNLGLRISSRANFGSKNFTSLINELSLRIIEASYIFFDIRSRLKIARGIGFSSNIKVSRHPTTLLGYFQSEKFASELQNPETLLSSSPDFEGRVFPQIIALAEKSKPLIVHVRLGDYTRNPHFGKLSNSYFNAVTAEALAKTDCKEIWLFSNEISRAREMISPRFRIPVIEMPLDDLAPSEVLKVMSLGQAYVISNSTFSWWAAQLACLRDNGISVYYPDPWFKEILTPVGLFPRKWESKPALFE